MGASVARRPRTPPDLARDQDLKARCSRCLRSEGDLFSIVVVGNYFERAGNEAHSGESYVFSHPSILLGPSKIRPTSGKVLVEPPGVAPGSGLVITRAFIAIVRRSGRI